MILLDQLLDNKMAWFCYIVVPVIALIILLNFVSWIFELFFTKKLKLDSKSVVLITGGFHGIGEKLCYLLAQNHQCKIVILDILKDRSESIMQTLKNLGSVPQFYYCDLNDSKQIENTFNSVMKDYHGQLDLLISNAGIFPGTTFEKSSLELMEKCNNINYLASAQLTQLALPYMLKNQKGHISYTGSVMGFSKALKNTHYAASKHALQLLVESIRLEFQSKEYPIDLTLICPWAINTGLLDNVNMKGVLKFLPILDQNQVAKEIYKSIIYRKRTVYISGRFKYITIIQCMLPVRLTDFLCNLFDI